MHEHIGATLAHAALRTGQHVRVRVNGTSMRPLMDVGDHVWVEQTPFASLRSGDVVTVWHNGGLLTHRVLTISAAGCMTKGDHCVASDEPIAAERIVGRVVVVEHGERRVNLQRQCWRRVGGWVARVGAAQAMLVRHPLRPVRASSLIMRAAMYSMLRLFCVLEDV